MSLAIVALITPAGLSAQQGPGSSVDYSANVRSQSLGTPSGQSSSAVDQYLQRKSLQDVSGGEARPVNASKLGPARPAKKDELVVGAPVNDKTGVAMAKVEQVDADGVIVSVGTAKIKVPAEAFGHNKAGLLLDTTKAQFEQVVAQANAPAKP
jgi:hypothetical protein